MSVARLSRLFLLAIGSGLFSIPVATAQSIDLRSYFPQRINHFRQADGTLTHFYAFQDYPISNDNWAGGLYLAYFNQNLPGSSLKIWQKTYSGCTVTYAFLLVGGGSDKRVQEVGDWADSGGIAGPCNGVYICRRISETSWPNYCT